MVFDFVEGKTLSDEEITVDHCKKIGKVLAKLHSLDYSSLELDRTIIKYTKLYDWESYLNNTNFEKMTYKELFTANYKKYNEITVDITTIWDVGEDEDTEITDEITLTESNIIADFSLANGDLRKWKQFLLAKGCDYRLKNNPYIEE